MRRQRSIPLSQKLAMLGLVIFVFGLCLMLNFGELPFLICLSFSLVCCAAGMILDHKDTRNRRYNRYLP